MKNISKKIIVSLLSIILVVSFAGCTVEQGGGPTFATAQRSPNPTPMDLRGEITISGYKSSEFDDSLMDYIAEVTLEYAGLEVVYDYDYTEEEYFATLDQRIASGDIGDVYMVRDSQVAGLAEAGKIIDLSSEADNFYDYSNSGYVKVDLSKELFPAAYDAGTYNGKLYMVASEYNHKFVYINYDLLKAAGIDEIPGDKWTWDTFKNYAKALTNNGAKIVMDYTDYAIWGAFVNGYGGSVFKTSTSNLGEVSVDYKSLNLTDNASMTGLNELVSFVKDNGVLKTLGTTDFATVGMAVVDRTEIASWHNSADSKYFDWSLLNYDWDFMHFPRFENHSVGAHASGFVVKNNPEMSEEIRMLCAKVAMFTLFDIACTAYIGDGEIVPANIKVSDKKFWREYPVKGKNTSVFTSYYTSDFCANFTPYMSLNAANQLNVGSAVEQAVNGGNLSALVSSAQSATTAAMK
ncbi:MAG: hypothetical protein E7388_05520 [Ruminococcaceae bacterium]|nr:hypothetical protein [Oscillospiraceae bacterium]